jgi:hypothetical protein
MRDYTGHHTCSQENGEEYVLANAPFMSHLVQGQPLPFLGRGYYFWDYDKAQAKKWGIDHYKSFYFIIEATIHTKTDNFLDLAGDRKQMEYFLNLAKRFVNKGMKANEWKIAKLIEFLKQLAKATPEIFPFQIIRAQDYNIFIDPQFKLFFRDQLAFTYLNPRYVFCLIVVNDVILSEKRIIFQS